MNLNVSWDETFINIAKEIAKHSTCVHYQVGAVIVNKGRIVSCGYNGSPPHMVECHIVMDELWKKYKFDNQCIISFEEFKKTDYFKQHHRNFSLMYEIHAEQNAIAFAARNGINIEDTIMYCTVSPCFQCAKLIISSGIKEVIYLEEYRKDDNGLLLLEESNVKYKKLEL